MDRKSLFAGFLTQERPSVQVLSVEKLLSLPDEGHGRDQ
jgi:hypothetical protein